MTAEHRADLHPRDRLPAFAGRAHGLWSISRGLSRGLKSRTDYKRMMDYADMPRQGDLDGRGNPRLNTLLARGGLDADAPAAMSFASNLDSVERIDRMQASHERRREQLLRDIERHRADLAPRLRDTSDALIDDDAAELADSR